MWLHFEKLFLWSRVLHARVLLLLTPADWFGFGLIILRGSCKETFRRGPHNVNKFQ